LELPQIYSHADFAATLIGVGLRERKKEQTRQRIADAAHRLFGERGFDGVTVAEVARAAEVAEATLFNYFPTKEDLFYSGLEAFGDRLIAAVRDRPAGAAVLPAFRDVVLGSGGQLERIAAGDRAALEHARTTARVISASPALRARERQALAAIAGELAAVLGPPGDPVAQAIANALMGVHGALIEYARRRLLADDRPAAIAADLQAAGERAFDHLDRGLAGFGPA
jgi:AcrR family transcriptional regulator